MTTYTYKITENKADGKIAVQIKEGSSIAANSLIMIGAVDFESYSVNEAYKNKGLSYILTYLMLLYCKDNGTRPPVVSNAHGVLMSSLPKINFPLQGAIRSTKGGKETAGTYQCGNIQLSIDLCKKILISKGLISEGFRNDGPYQWKTA